MIYIYIHNYSHLYIGMKCSGSMVQPLPAPGDPWAQEFALSSDSLCRQGVGECWAMEQPWSIRKNTTIDHHIYLHYCWLSHLIPSGNQTWQWKIPVTNGGFNGKIIYKWGISIATFDFRRVSLYYVDRFKPPNLIWFFSDLWYPLTEASAGPSQGFGPMVHGPRPHGPDWAMECFGCSQVQPRAAKRFVTCMSWDFWRRQDIDFWRCFPATDLCWSGSSIQMKASSVQDYTACEVELLESTSIAELCRLTG